MKVYQGIENNKNDQFFVIAVTHNCTKVVATMISASTCVMKKCSNLTVLKMLTFQIVIQNQIFRGNLKLKL